jgi:hypothetical protein
MACDEIGALRLALMNVLGGSRSAERQHEEAELGVALRRDGPIKSLASSTTLEDAKQQLDGAIVELEQRQAEMAPDDPKFHYTKTLLVAVKGAEATYRRLQSDVEHFYRSLEEVHDLIHEIYPAD